MTDDMIDKKLRSEIIRALSEKVVANYVFPDIAKEIAAHLEKHLNEGSFTGITEGKFFAYALTSYLQEINQDEHLWVRWYPEPLPDENKTLRFDETWVNQQKQAAKLDNFGFHKVERLPGNIGYLDIHYFHRPAWGGDTAVAALNFVANSLALIIDLRACSGGYPGMVALVASYLFGPEPVHLNSIYWRDYDITEQYWTLPYVPGCRYPVNPVYVLISKESFSGGEEFAYDLQAQERAVIVGQKTDGGAHPGASYRLHPHFEVFIPIGQAVNPVTNGNWEASGVEPDIPVHPDQALDVAYKMALVEIVQNLGDPAENAKRKILAEAKAALDALGSI